MTETKSANPIVQAIVSGKAPRQARLAAARGLLPLPQDELIEVLVTLAAGEEEEIAAAAGETLGEQTPDALTSVAASAETSAAVLKYLAARPDSARETQEALALNSQTPDEAVATLAGVTRDGAVLEIISINQQRLIRAPAIIEALLANSARTPEAERRTREIQREFFEKERGVRQIAEEMRARGMTAAAEFIESAESFAETAESSAADVGLAIEDAWIVAEHIEVSDDEVDDSWLPSEWLEELIEETFEQRTAAAERLVAEMSAEAGESAPKRMALIRRVMLMKVKDRIKLAMKGDREARAILIRDSNRIVATAVVHNPRITDQEVEGIAAMRTISDEVLRIIGLNRAWARSYPIIHNLARNPRAPLGTSMNILPRLYTKDLKAIAQNRNVPEAVRRQAVRLSTARTQ